MIFSHLNYLAIVVATVAYFLLGWLWYTVVFRKPWMEGHGIAMPTTDAEKEKMKKGMPKTLAGAFICCFILTMALAYISYGSSQVSYNSIQMWMKGIKEGMLTAIFAGVPIALNYMHTNKTVKLFLIDAGYHFVGLIIAGIILSVWS